MIRILLVVILLFFGNVTYAKESKSEWIPESIGYSTSIKPIGNVHVKLLTLADINISCASQCIEYGLHFGRARVDVEYDKTIRHYNFGGVDVYARITGGDFWQRWGFGLTFFDRQDDQLETPWAFHTSLQSGWWVISDVLAITFGLHHWSNGLRVGEFFGEEEHWPTDENGEPTNGGGNAFNFGLVGKF